MSPFSWQGQNLCGLSLAFIIDWSIVDTLIFLQFVKHLMFQRKQIPSSIDAIRKDVETQQSAAAAPDPQTTTVRGGPASVQEKLKRKRLADKQSRTREKYLTRAKTFLDSYQALEDDICRHLDQVFSMLTSLRTCCKSIVQNSFH